MAGGGRLISPRRRLPASSWSWSRTPAAWWIRKYKSACDAGLQRSKNLMTFYFEKCGFFAKNGISDFRLNSLEFDVLVLVFYKMAGRFDTKLKLIT